MNTLSFARSLLATLAIGALSSAALAQNPAAPDIEASCPGISARLSDKLDPVLRDRGQNGDVIVSFQIEQGKVKWVKTSGDNLAYARAVRRAVAGFTCQNQLSTQGNAAQFRVQLLEPDTALTSVAAAGTLTQTASDVKLGQ
jgi:hypothetical protein